MKLSALGANVTLFPLLFTSLCLAAQPAQDASPLAHLQKLVPEAERTQVMVFGTFHFAEIKGRFQPSMVEPVLRQLEAFKPDIIAVEMLPGSHIHALELRSKATSLHEEMLNEYANAQLELGHEAQKLLKVDAIEAAKALASSKGSSPLPPVSRTLHLLAAYELPSALLSWSTLSPEDPSRTQIPPSLAQKLEAQRSRINEVQQLAIPLARRLGLREIACVDEFEDAETMEPVIQALMASIKQAPLLASASKSQVYLESKRRQDAALEAGDLTPFFRHLNAAAYMTPDVDAQWGVFLRTRLKDGSDRGRLALWENRNFKIAGRIRAISARYPGKRLLVVYGVAHKPFLDAYLGTCSDLQIVQPSAFLKQDAATKPTR